MNALLYILGGLAVFTGVIIAIASYLAPSYACNVKNYTIQGEVVTYFTNTEVEEDEDAPLQTSSAWFVDTLPADDADASVDAIILEIDSWGGSPVAAEEIANAIKRMSKPVVVVIRSAATSAAYWAISSADHIVASANSDVGSIGVILSYLDNVKKNEIEGLTYNSISSGEFKLIGDPNVPLTDEDRALIQRDVDIIHANFVSAVSTNRELPQADVAALADGSTMLGEMAKQKGLIDAIGDVQSAKEYLGNLLGKEIRLCERS